MRKLGKRLEKMKEYPWLDRAYSVDRYVGSEYYDKLLEDYVFQGKSDLEHFRDHLKRLPSLDNALELGAGNGRATQVFLDTTRCKKLTLVDLSSDMLNGARKRFRNKNLNYAQSDIISYLSQLRGKFDFIFTLWSFSHSVHHHLDRMGLRKGRWMVGNILKKVVIENMNKGSELYFVHFDSLSDEQRILLKQWKRKIPIFRYTNIQSPSKRYIDKSLRDMKNEGLIQFDVQHYIGKVIKYVSMNDALEIFMNFHLESFFNRGNLTRVVLEDIEKYLKLYQKPDGTICIKPGCFIYSITKII
jgi:hypothetical protein